MEPHSHPQERTAPISLPQNPQEVGATIPRSRSQVGYFEGSKGLSVCGRLGVV